MVPVAIVVERDDRSRRVLTRLLDEYGVDTVHTAADGAHAAALLAEAKETSALITVSLSDQEQLGILEPLRHAAPGTHTSLLVTTSRPTVRMVQQLADAGVTAILRKPLHVAAVRSRLAEALYRLVTARIQPQPLLTAGSTVLMVDGDAAYCRMLATQAGAWWRVSTATTGVEAFAAAVATPPHAVFVGEGIGLLNPARFVHRFQRGEGVGLFLLASAGAAPTPELASLVDAVLPRAWSPDLVRQMLSRFLLVE